MKTKNNNKFLYNYFSDISKISKNINLDILSELIKEIAKIKSNKGRIFFLGVGGSAGNCSHAVNDFRKLCSIESYTPVDNTSELTARINDDGWKTSFSNWLEISKITKKDAIFIFSVGGGDIKRRISLNLIEAIKLAKKNKTKILGVVGRDKCYTKKNGDCILTIPNYNKLYLTPHSESFQAIVWHAIVSHPLLKSAKTKW
tara:strand:+ start:136 stop:738 length:603 start_codon:yes stop_codon:yes gene_type:complete